MNPLNTVRGAMTTGFVLAVVLTLLIAPTAFHELGLARWFHILSGITWIGLLYYFNFVQVAALKAATADGTNAGITKHVAPRALLFFRWSALVTWLAGAALLSDKFVDAFTLRHGMAGIGVGAWLNERPLRVSSIETIEDAALSTGTLSLSGLPEWIAKGGFEAGNLEVSLDMKPLGQLIGHQFFTVTDGHNFAALDSLDLGHMRIRDLPASDYGDLKHGAPPRGSLCNST